MHSPSTQRNIRNISTACCFKHVHDVCKNLRVFTRWRAKHNMEYMECLWCNVRYYVLEHGLDFPDSCSIKAPDFWQILRHCKLWIHWNVKRNTGRFIHHNHTPNPLAMKYGYWERETPPPSLPASLPLSFYAKACSTNMKKVCKMVIPP